MRGLDTKHSLDFLMAPVTSKKRKKHQQHVPCLNNIFYTKMIFLHQNQWLDQILELHSKILFHPTFELLERPQKVYDKTETSQGPS